MKFIRQNWLISRRQVLRGFGVSLALPLLDCMRPLRAVAARQGFKPRRSAFIYLPNGVNTLDYQIAEEGMDYTFTESLRPLEKHRMNITPISGLHHPNGLGHDHNCRKIWLTGGKLGQADRNSISVDQLIAQMTAPRTRFASMELSNKGGALSWNPDGIQLPAQSNPGVVFREFFEEPKDGIAKQRRSLHRQGSILDTILHEAKVLSNQLGKNDRGRLDQYLTSVREVEIRTERADKWLDIPRPKLTDEDKSRVNQDVPQQMVGEYFRTMYDLIVLAFQTDITRVATFSTGEEGQGLPIPEIGLKQDRHSLSHHNGNVELMKNLTLSDTFNIKQFSYFLDRLSEVQDADGTTLLETTMALYGSGMAFGHSHGNANLPIVLAGGAKLGLKHGRHIDFNKTSAFSGYDLANPSNHYNICHNPVNQQAHLSNLLLTVAQRMGVETDKFADSNGVISELLI